MVGGLHPLVLTCARFSKACAVRQERLQRAKQRRVNMQGYCRILARTRVLTLQHFFISGALWLCLATLRSRVWHGLQNPSDRRVPIELTPIPLQDIDPQPVERAFDSTLTCRNYIPVEE